MRTTGAVDARRPSSEKGGTFGPHAAPERTPLSRSTRHDSPYPCTNAGAPAAKHHHPIRTYTSLAHSYTATHKRPTLWPP